MASIHSLPVEIISRILVLSCEAFGTDPFQLSHIDGRLREIAFTTTELWEGMFVYQEPRDLQWLHFLAERISPRAIDAIVLVAGGDCGTRWRHFSDFLQPNAHRIRKLRIQAHTQDNATDWIRGLTTPALDTFDNRSRIFSIFSIFDLPLPMLSSLHIDLSFSTSIPSWFGQLECNSLREIEIHHASLEHEEFWKKGIQLERLTLDLAPNQENHLSLHSILSIQSTLQELSLTLPEDFTHTTTDVLQFPNMKKFCLISQSGIVLATLSMPVLQCFHLRSPKLDEPHVEHPLDITVVQNFLALHASTLEDFHRIPVDPHNGSAPRKEIRRMSSTGYNIITMSALKNALVSVFGWFNDVFHIMYCPNLERLDLEIADEVPPLGLFNFIEMNRTSLRFLHIKRATSCSMVRYPEPSALALGSEYSHRLLHFPQLQEFVSESARGDDIFGLIEHAPRLRAVKLSGNTFEPEWPMPPSKHLIELPTLETLTLAQFSEPLRRVHAPQLANFTLFSVDMFVRQPWDDQHIRKIHLPMCADVEIFLEKHANSMRTLVLLDSVGIGRLQQRLLTRSQSDIRFPQLIYASFCKDDPILEYTTAPKVQTLELRRGLYTDRFRRLNLGGWRAASTLVLADVREFPELTNFDSLLQLRIHINSSDKGNKAIADWLRTLANPVKGLDWYCPRLQTLEIYAIEPLDLTWPGRFPEEDDDYGSSYQPSVVSSSDLYGTDYECSEDWEDASLYPESTDLNQDDGEDGIEQTGEDVDVSAVADNAPASWLTALPFYPLISSTPKTYSPSSQWESLGDWESIMEVVEGRSVEYKVASISKVVMRQDHRVAPDLQLSEAEEEWLRNYPGLEFVME